MGLEYHLAQAWQIIDQVGHFKPSLVALRSVFNTSHISSSSFSKDVSVHFMISDTIVIDADQLTAVNCKPGLLLATYSHFRNRVMSLRF
jgi:hypothetical protein